MKHTIIGIAGAKFSGKDTVGRAIAARAARQGLGTDRIFFAEPMKQALCTMFGWTMEQLEDEHWKEQEDPYYGFTPRKAMVTLGTEWGRVCMRDDLWLIIARRKIEASLRAYRLPFVTDVRFENEASMIRDMGGTILHIDNGQKRPAGSHPSEQGIALAAGDLYFRNDKEKGMVPVYEFVDDIFKGK